ncbi:MAG: hypothetical protein HUU10_04485 [Bacteroidetes bacterium]|nr:hypothetical protein [Bacteroidota bacterium]
MPINVTTLTIYANTFGGELELNVTYSAEGGEHDFLFVMRKKGSAITNGEITAAQTAIGNGTYEQLVLDSWNEPTKRKDLRYFDRLVHLVPRFIDIEQLNNGDTYHYHLFVGTEGAGWTFGTGLSVSGTPENGVEFPKIDPKAEVVSALRFAIGQAPMKAGYALKEGKDFEIVTSYPKTQVKANTTIYQVSRINGDNIDTLMDNQDYDEGPNRVKTFMDSDVFRIEWRCPEATRRDIVTRLMKLVRLHIIQYLQKRDNGITSVRMSVGGDMEEIREESGGIEYIGFMNVMLQVQMQITLTNPDVHPGIIEQESSFS